MCCVVMHKQASSSDDDESEQQVERCNQIRAASFDIVLEHRL